MCGDRGFIAMTIRRNGKHKLPYNPLYIGTKRMMVEHAFKVVEEDSIYKYTK